MTKLFKVGDSLNVAVRRFLERTKLIEFSRKGILEKGWARADYQDNFKVVIFPRNRSWYAYGSEIEGQLCDFLDKHMAFRNANVRFARKGSSPDNAELTTN